MKASAKEIAKAHEDRPTAVLPGSDGTGTGTAITELLDDEGEPIYGRDKETADPGAKLRHSASTVCSSGELPDGHVGYRGHVTRGV